MFGVAIDERQTGLRRDCVQPLEGMILAIVKDVCIEQLQVGDRVYTGSTRHLAEEWQTVRSVKGPSASSRTYGVGFGGLTIERQPGTKMRVQIGEDR